MEKVSLGGVCVCPHFMPGCSGECPCNEFAIAVSQGYSWMWSYLPCDYVFVYRGKLGLPSVTTFYSNASVHVNRCFVCQGY